MKRLTYLELIVRTGQIRRENRHELTITYDEFCDLRMDMEFVNSFAWAMMEGVPTEFKCNGVLCKVVK